jgi:hypothetical protein
MSEDIFITDFRLKKTPTSFLMGVLNIFTCRAITLSKYFYYCAEILKISPSSVVA